MDEQQFLNLNEIDAILNDSEFLEALDIQGNIDVEQLPPEDVEQSDLEEIDEVILDTYILKHHQKNPKPNCPLFNLNHRFLTAVGIMNTKTSSNLYDNHSLDGQGLKELFIEVN